MGFEDFLVSLKKLTLATIISLSLPISAAQIAIVQSKKAVIYADVDLQSPVGYVRKGKQLQVGNVKRHQNQVLPVVVNGQVAWVKVIDLYLPEEERPSESWRKVSEHEVLEDDEVKDPMDQNNYLSLKMSPATLALSGTAESSSGATSSFDQEVQSGIEYDLLYEHKNPYHSMHWGVGLSYASGTLDGLEYAYTAIKGGMSWAAIRTSLVNIEAYGNLVLSGDFRLKSIGLGTYKGNFYGLDYGAIARFLPESKLGFFAGVGGSWGKFNNLSDIFIDGSSSTYKLDSLQGSKVEFGLTYKL